MRETFFQIFGLSYGLPMMPIICKGNLILLRVSSIITINGVQYPNCSAMYYTRAKTYSYTVSM